MIKIRSWYGHPTKKISMRWEEDHVFQSAAEIDSVEAWNSPTFPLMKSIIRYKDNDGREQSVYSDETTAEIKAKIAKESGNADATNNEHHSKPRTFFWVENGAKRKEYLYLDFSRVDEILPYTHSDFPDVQSILYYDNKQNFIYSNETPEHLIARIEDLEEYSK